MRPHPIRAVSVLIFASLASCGDNPTGLDRDRSAPVQTERLSYSVDRESFSLFDVTADRFSTTIGYEFTNQTGQTVYLVTCHGPSFFLEKKTEGGAWQPVWWGADYEDCLAPAIVIEPDMSYVGLLEVSGFEPHDGIGPNFTTVDLNGVFRLILDSAVFLQNPEDYPRGSSVGTEFLRSNEFKLKVR
jgi:hypothetical protein